MPTSRSWADLPEGILTRLARDLPFADYLQFASTCSEWRAALSQPQEVLLVGHLYKHIYSCNAFEFHGVVRDQLVRLPIPLSPSLISRGSSRGWLLLASFPISVFPRLMLYHPFHQFIIELPTCTALTDHRSQFSPDYIQKFVLSADPATSPNDWIAFAVANNHYKSSCPHYAFYRPGNRFWTPLAPAPNAESCDWPDVEFYRRKFYVATRSQLLICKIDKEPPRMKVLERAGPEVRSLTGFPRSVGRRELEVYKVNFLKSNRVELLKQEDVGEHALFLGENHSFALNSICYPSCRRNTIYLACHGNSRPQIPVHRVNSLHGHLGQKPSGFLLVLGRGKFLSHGASSRRRRRRRGGGRAGSAPASGGIHRLRRQSHLDLISSLHSLLPDFVSSLDLSLRIISSFNRRPFSPTPNPNPNPNPNRKPLPSEHPRRRPFPFPHHPHPSLPRTRPKPSSPDRGERLTLVRTMVAVCLLELVPFSEIDSASLLQRLESDNSSASPAERAALADLGRELGPCAPSRPRFAASPTRAAPCSTGSSRWARSR
uniref:F-box domain-containing protein n=1 Tax=Ananas comosus var. bracteatus TaxID=296719 RepID=A0A6V7QVY4_ANACO